MADTTQNTDDKKKVKVNGFPLFQILEDGTVRRFVGLQTVAADPHDSAAAAKSKDVIIDSERGLFVRIFLPRTAAGAGTENLAVIFFVHGGGFCAESAASSTYDPYVRRLAAEARALCVSVEYRRAPETRLPAAYDDSFAALTWLLAGAGRHDTWVAPVAAGGGFGRLVLAGDSAGANIVHDLGLRAAAAAADGWPSDVRFCGAVMLHPFFHVPRSAAADDDDRGRDVASILAAMVSSCMPVGEDVEDYPPFNPAGPRSRPLSESVFQRFLVAVAQEDPIRQAGLEYYRQLVKAGKRAELEQTPEQGHVFFLKDQSCAASLALMKRVVQFVHCDDN